MTIEAELTETDIGAVEAEFGAAIATLSRQHGFFPTGWKTVIARRRRGKWVAIPAAWRGRTVTNEEIRKRPSKMTRKRRRRMAAEAGMKRSKDARAPSFAEFE